MAGPPRRAEGLSPQEKRVVECLAEGLMRHEVATYLHLSPETVKTHVRRALERNDVQTSAGLVAMSLRRGWIE